MIVGWLAIPGLAVAQDLSRRVIEVSGGFAGFVDESIIPHGTVGAAVRWDVAPHLSVGPELVYMAGGSDDQHVHLTGKVVVDFLRDRAASPYFVADGGLMIARLTFARPGDFWYREGAVSFGGGARINAQPPVLRGAGSADWLGAAHPFHRDCRFGRSRPAFARGYGGQDGGAGARRDDNFASQPTTFEGEQPAGRRVWRFSGRNPAFLPERALHSSPP